MNEQTLDKLIQMRFTVFAESYRKQTEDPSFDDLSFHERISLLVDAEFDSRHNHKILRLLQNANPASRQAQMENIEYFTDRKLNKGLLSELSTNTYLRQHHNITLTGATGTGKTFIACALGTKACRDHYTVRYIRLPELFADFELARIQNTYKKMMKQYKNVDLVILDEFLLVTTSKTEQRDLLKLMEARCGKGSIVFCTQYSAEGWHLKLGSGALADSILDRIIPSSYKITIEGKESMRQRHGLKQ